MISGTAFQEDYGTNTSLKSSLHPGIILTFLAIPRSVSAPLVDHYGKGSTISNPSMMKCGAKFHSLFTLGILVAKNVLVTLF